MSGGSWRGRRRQSRTDCELTETGAGSVAFSGVDGQSRRNIRLIAIMASALPDPALSAFEGPCKSDNSDIGGS